MTGVDGLPYGIALKGDDVIGVVRGIGQSMFPQAIGISLFPHAMIAFVDYALEGNARLLEGADVVSEVHEQSGIRRQLSQPDCELSFQLIARAHVDFSFLQSKPG